LGGDAVGLDDAKASNFAREMRAIVQPAECGADPGDVDLGRPRRRRTSSRGNLGLDERDHLGAEAEVGRNA